MLRNRRDTLFPKHLPLRALSKSLLGLSLPICEISCGSILNPLSLSYFFSSGDALLKNKQNTAIQVPKWQIDQRRKGLWGLETPFVWFFSLSSPVHHSSSAQNSTKDSILQPENSRTLLLKPHISLLPSQAAATHGQAPEDAAGTWCL